VRRHATRLPSALTNPFCLGPCCATRATTVSVVAHAHAVHLAKYS
jgi:hypothetical protein